MKNGLLRFLFLLFTSISLAQTPYNYQVKTDLQDHTIYCMEQDDFGRLILGTDKGVYRFNGYKTKRLTFSHATSKEIIQIAKLAEGFLALNKSGQVLRILGDSVVGIKLDQFSGNIRKLSVADNLLAVLTTAFIYEYDLTDLHFIGKTAIPFAEEKGVFAIDFFQFNKREYVLLNSGELVDVNDRSARVIPMSGTRWLGEWNKRLVLVPEFSNKQNTLIYSDGVFKNKGKLDNRRNHKITGAKVIGNTLYLFADQGVYVLPKTGFKAKLIFEDKIVQDVFLDSHKNKWFATKAKGLFCIPFGNYTLLRSTPYLSLEFGPKKTIYAGLPNGTIDQLSQTGKSTAIISSFSVVQEIIQLNYNSSLGILSCNSGVVQNNKVTANTPTETVIGWSKLTSGAFVVSTTLGVKKFENLSLDKVFKRLSDTTVFSVIVNSPVRHVANNGSDKTAINTIDGVFVLDESGDITEIKYYNKSIDAQQVAWYKGSLYIATSTNKLLFVSGNKVKRERIMSDDGNTLLVQKLSATNTYLYVLTEKGIYRMKGINGKMESFKDAFTINGLSVRDFIVDGNTLFLATQYGLMKIEWTNSVSLLPKIVLGQPSGNDIKAIKEEGVKFGTSANLIVLPFELVDLMSNKGYNLQYRLIHSEDTTGWSTVASESDRIQLSFLGSGDYCFELRSIDVLSGQTSPNEKRFFSIEPSWYENTWWMWFLLGGAMVYTALRYRRINRMRIESRG